MRSVFGQADPKGGKLLGPTKRRRAVVWVRERLGAERVSRACQVLGQARSTQRRERHIPVALTSTDHGHASLGRVESESQAGGEVVVDRRG